MSEAISGFRVRRSRMSLRSCGLPARSAAGWFASSASANCRLRHATNWHDGQISKTCPVPTQKIFRFTRDPNHPHNSAHLIHPRGVGHVTNARWDAVDANGIGWRRCLTRTVKSCGSGAAVLALSPRAASCLGATEARKPFSGKSTK